MGAVSSVAIATLTDNRADADFMAMVVTGVKVQISVQGVVIGSSGSCMHRNAEQWCECGGSLTGVRGKYSDLLG